MVPVLGEGERWPVPTLKIVEVHSFKKGERWYGYKFKVEERFKDQEIQVYGPTPRDAENRLHEELRRFYGLLGYSIRVLTHEQEN